MTLNGHHPLYLVQQQLADTRMVYVLLRSGRFFSHAHDADNGISWRKGEPMRFTPLAARRIFGDNDGVKLIQANS